MDRVCRESDQESIQFLEHSVDYFGDWAFSNYENDTVPQELSIFYCLIDQDLTIDIVRGAESKN